MDFMHVSTYIPVIFQLLRASVLLTLLEAVLLVQQHFAMLLAIAALITYLDGRAFYNERLNRACGFLVPVGLVFCVNKAMLLQFTTCTLSNTTRVVYYVLATAWATCGLGMLGMLSMDTLANVQSRVSDNTFVLVSCFLVSEIKHVGTKSGQIPCYLYSPLQSPTREKFRSACLTVMYETTIPDLGPDVWDFGFVCKDV